MSKIVERTLNLLELFAEEKRPLVLSDIARRMKIPVSSCHDVLQAMQSRGYLYELAPRAGYYPTLRLRELGKTISEHDPVAMRAENLLRPISDAVGECVLLAKVSGLQAHYLLILEPAHLLIFRIRVGDTVQGLHSTAGGKALLGSLPDAELDKVLASIRWTPTTALTITDKDLLRADIKRGRERGWYLDQGESHEGVTSLSVPFRWGSAVYIVTAAGPSLRLDAKVEWVAGLVVEAARVLASTSQ